MEQKKQYCRYCADCCMQDDDLYICLACESNMDAMKKGTMGYKWLDNKSIRRANKCKYFKFCEIAVDNHDVIYKPMEQNKIKKENKGEQNKWEI